MKPRLSVRASSNSVKARLKVGDLPGWLGDDDEDDDWAPPTRIPGAVSIVMNDDSGLGYVRLGPGRVYVRSRA